MNLVSFGSGIFRQDQECENRRLPPLAPTAVDKVVLFLGTGLLPGFSEFILPMTPDVLGSYLSFNSVPIMENKSNEFLKLPVSVDNGGRRSGGDRRNYSYSLHIPERRRGRDRRLSRDRRKFPRMKDQTRN